MTPAHATRGTGGAGLGGGCPRRRFLLVRLLCVFLSLSALGVGAAAEDAQQQQPSVGKVRSSAELAFSNGDMENALKGWNQVIALEPNNDGNFFKRFRVYLRQNKYKEALADLNSALHLKPANEQAVTQKGKLEIRLGRCADAHATLLKLQRCVFLSRGVGGGLLLLSPLVVGLTPPPHPTPHKA